MINRFSSRRHRLDAAFLHDKLKGARSYKRIAGYFRSSIFELVGEEIENIPLVQVVCNSELDAIDIAVARHARETALLERWNDVSPEMEALLYRERYRTLYELLTKGTVEIRIVQKDRIFIHGKAGVIECADGSKTCFIGSINESKRAFAHNYEILWEDTSPEGVAWVEEEFEALWKDAFPLPDTIIQEIGRVSKRIQVYFKDIAPEEFPAATLAEAPIYRSGEKLQPWQRSFVTTFLEHRSTYGCARLLLADEVGLGKTLSLATAGLVSCLMGDGPVLILCPATLTLQWQVELMDKLGIPSAVWLSSKKVWLDYRGHEIQTRGPDDIARCPMQIGIVSTGLIFHNSEECEHLLKRKYGTVILDEAHRARRRGGLSDRDRTPNNLLEFMMKISNRTKNLLLGTATPIQTQVYELWDLLRILNGNVDFVLGREIFSNWADCEQALRYIKGEAQPADEREGWDLMRNPLPPAKDHELFNALRLQLYIPDDKFFSDIGFGSLNPLVRQSLAQALRPNFFKDNNPVVRHTVLRRRRTLEDAGLLERIGVNVHPVKDAPSGYYAGVNFKGLGLIASHPFNVAYKAAEDFTRALYQRTNAAGFIKTLLLQRICSSFASGLATAQKMSEHALPDDEEEMAQFKGILDDMTQEELNYLDIIINELSRSEIHDPKFNAVKFFLTEFQTEGNTWLEHGCIIFSQYYDTVKALATWLDSELSGEPIAIYAGAGKSGMFRYGNFANVEREDIKAAVRKHELRLIVATDAACEGLNLQTLGTLINVDLPWNPSRLEQRLGRIKRIGQRRQNVDILNLVYHGTQDETIYEVLSKRMKDRYDIFGSLPDVIEDEWIENIEELEEKMNIYMHLRKNARDAFEIRYEKHIDPDKDRWELCARVLSRRDILDALSCPWY